MRMPPELDSFWIDPLLHGIDEKLSDVFFFNLGRCRSHLLRQYENLVDFDNITVFVY